MYLDNALITSLYDSIQNKLLELERSPSSLSIFAAIKQRNPTEIEWVLNSPFISGVGENRIEHALVNWQVSRPKKPIHFIGHLQSRKVKDAVALFDVIESVDSIKLLKKINFHAQEIQKKQRIFLRINPLKEKQKDGFTSKEDIARCLQESTSTTFIQIDGAMTMAPQTDDSQEIRECFSLTRQWWQELKKEFSSLELGKELSMGMSQDYHYALEEGSTIIRLGRILFDR